jgi:hypothetical protein
MHEINLVIRTTSITTEYHSIPIHHDQATARPRLIWKLTVLLETEPLRCQVRYLCGRPKTRANARSASGGGGGTPEQPVNATVTGT